MGDTKVEADGIITKETQSTYKATMGPKGAVSSSYKESSVCSCKTRFLCGDQSPSNEELGSHVAALE